VRAAAHKIAKEMAAFPLGEKSLPLFKRMIKHPSRLKDLEDVFDMVLFFFLSDRSAHLL